MKMSEALFDRRSTVKLACAVQYSHTWRYHTAAATSLRPHVSNPDRLIAEANENWMHTLRVLQSRHVGHAHCFDSIGAGGCIEPLIPP
jgi:hypothetical protein